MSQSKKGRKSQRKMTPILFATLAAGAMILAIILMPQNEWQKILNPPDGFEPGIGKTLVWIGTIGAIVFFAIFGAGHALVSERYRQFEFDNTPAPKTEQEKVVERLATQEDFIDHGTVDVVGADGTIVTLRILAKPGASARNIETTAVSLVDDDGKETKFAFSILFDDYSWKQGSDRQFRGPRRPRVDLNIETALQDEYLRQGVLSAQRVYCVGLADYELDELSPEENEQLSDARGINLCRALFKIGYINPEWQKLYMVGGGYAKESDVVDPSLQRIAIIVSVEHSDVALTVEEFVFAIDKLTNLKGLDLKNYSRKPSSFVSTLVRSGEYVDFRELRYKDREDKSHLVPITPRRETED